MQRSPVRPKNKRAFTAREPTLAAHNPSLKTIMARLLLVGSVVLASYLSMHTAYSIVADANWRFGDDFMFLVTTAIGKPMWPNINPQDLRYVPLGFFEYNLFLPLGDVPHIYFSWEALKFLVIVGALLTSMLITTAMIGSAGNTKRIPQSLAFLFIACFIVSPGLFIVVSRASLSESTQLACFALFLAFYLSAIRWERLQTYLYPLSFAFGNYAFYCKEPMFGAVLVAIAVPLMLGFSSIGQRRRAFCMFMLTSCLVFLLSFYMLAVDSPIDLAGHYHKGRFPGFSLGSFVAFLVENNLWLIVISVPIAAYRLFDTILGLARKARRSTTVYTFDGLLYGGLAYVFAYYILKIVSVHYFVPASAFLVVALYYYACCLIAKLAERPALRIAAVLTTLILATSYFFAVIGLHDVHIVATGMERRAHVPTLQRILPELESSHLLLVVPESTAFASEFQKTAVLQFYYYVTVQFVEFLSEKELSWNIYDPYKALDGTWIRSMGDRIVHSLASIDADKEIVAVLVTTARNEKTPEELVGFDDIEGTENIFPVSFLMRPDPEDSGAQFVPESEE